MVPPQGSKVFTLKYIGKLGLDKLNFLSKISQEL